MVRLTCVVSLLFISQVVLFGGMNGNTDLQVNIGPIPFDVYTGPNTMFKGKCSGVTHRKCVQDALQGYASQGVTGVRFQIPWFMEGWSHPLLSNGQINPAWVKNLGYFFDDVVAAGISRVIPTPSLAAPWSTHEEQPAAVSDPCSGTSKPAADPHLDDPNIPPTDGVVFYQTAPFPFWRHYTDTTGKHFSTTPWGQWNQNQTYNCAPNNAVNFVGWTAIYSVFGKIAEVASSKGLIIDEIDIQNEMSLSNFTVYGRLIVDNKHGNEKVLDGIRQAVQQYMSDTRVTYSTPETHATGPATGDPFDCGSMWGDSARLLHLSSLSGAIAGPYGKFGSPSFGTKTYGLYCGGTTANMVSLPFTQAQPGVVDVHIYPCVGSFPGCSSNPRVRKSAEISYNDLKAFLNWRNPSATAVIGETWWTQNFGLQPGPVNAAGDNVNGYNDSTLDTHSRVVMRPWSDLKASDYPQVQALNPPYTP